MTGTAQSRPGWDKLLDYARPGDTLVVTELSRMSRSLLHLLQVVEDLGRREVAIVSLRENIDTTTWASSAPQRPVGPSPGMSRWRSGTKSGLVAGAQGRERRLRQAGLQHHRHRQPPGICSPLTPRPWKRFQSPAERFPVDGRRQGGEGKGPCSGPARARPSRGE
ncbi:MAG: recombinase family protein [Myxococcales bacterium]|nr:recombinase family protein [Myxococcales bacterium]